MGCLCFVLVDSQGLNFSREYSWEVHCCDNLLARECNADGHEQPYVFSTLSGEPRPWNASSGELKLLNEDSGPLAAEMTWCGHEGVAAECAGDGRKIMVQRKAIESGKLVLVLLRQGKDQGRYVRQKEKEHPSDTPRQEPAMIDCKACPTVSVNPLRFAQHPNLSAFAIPFMDTLAAHGYSQPRHSLISL